MAPATFREVLLEVAIDVVRAHGTQPVQFAGLVDHGHHSAAESGPLRGKRANASACPVQEHLLAGLDPAGLCARPTSGARTCSASTRTRT